MILEFDNESSLNNEIRYNSRILANLIWIYTAILCIDFNIVTYYLLDVKYQDTINDVLMNIEFSFENANHLLHTMPH